MASVHKHKRSPYWFCSYVLPDGRRAFRSTKQTDRKKAQDVCRALERASEKVRAGEVTEVQLRKLLDDILESVGARALPFQSVRTFATSWLAGKRVSVTAPTHRHLESVLARFLDSLGPRADRSLAGITPSDVALYRDSRLGTVASGTLALEIKAIKSLFGSARRQGLTLHNPVENIEMPRVHSLEREVFSQEEISALLGVASPEWTTLILCGFYLGARLRDASRLTWDAIDLASGTITYTAGKTNAKIVVPIHPQLEEHLLALAGNDHPHGALCPLLAKKRIDGNTGLSNQFVRLMTRVGIDRRQVKSVRNQFSRRSFHSLRHSHASILAMHGVPPEVRMKLVGHRNSQVHQGYTHHELSVLKTAIETLPNLRTT